VVPTYDYRCKACGQELEVFQSFSDDPLTTCEACGGELRKLFGAPGIAFKGSGFYKTDSRSRAKAGSSSTSESSTSSSDAKSGSDSKGDSSSNGSSATSAAKKEPAASSAKSD
jgi:putative FmdB family regulatory protein